MKSSQLLLIFVCITTIQQTMSHINNHEERVPQEIINLLRRLSKYCTPRTEVTDADMALIRQNIIPESRTGLAYLQCMMEKLGIVVNGTFRKHAVITTFEPVMRHNADRRKLLKKVTDECAEKLKTMEVNEYGDLARNILQCFEKYKGECNIQLPTDIL